jgi:gliding motility-associated protein GldM
MSGAKNCPETPRQKMIGMMYLFLTAMLALNVSSEVLNGFVMVNNSLLQSIISEKSRNEDLYSQFEYMNKNNPKKVGEWLSQAKEVKKKSDDLYNYIENFKLQVAKLADGKDANSDQLRNLDNLDVAGEYALVRGNGAILKGKITEYKNFLISKVNGDQNKIEMFNRNFATKNGKDGKSWQESIFEMMPVAASTTILTKYQSDVKAAEGEMIKFLMAQTDLTDYRVNKMVAYVIPVSTYVMQGDKYSAKIILSAVDSTQTPDYFVNGRQLGKDGLFEVTCNQTGSFDYKGNIIYKSGGNARSLPFASTYTVGAKGATVTNTALNVVYAGIDNELSASVPGVAASNVTLACAGATLTRKPNGLWSCHTLNTSGKITFAISAKMEGAKGFAPMGSMTFTVRQLPDPKPFLVYKDNGGVERRITEGNMTLGMLNNAVMVADYVNELISANFTVIGFSIEYPNGEQLDSNGSTLTSAQKNRLGMERTGARILIKGIRAVGPDRLVRSLPLIAVKLTGR